MIIVSISGGLGNQMFEYATARRLAHIRGVTLKLDLSTYGPEGDTQAKGLEGFRRQVRLQQLQVTAEQATDAEIAALKDPYTNNSRTISRIVRRLRKFKPSLGWPATHFRERGYRFDPAVLDLPSSVYLAGFWQSEKYFSDIADMIRKEFTPRDPAINEYAAKYVDKLRSPGSPLVSVHVRRGELAYAQDKLKNTTGTFGPPTSLDYIGQALSKFDSNCKFLIFSDSAPDIQWCKENIKAGSLYFSEGHNDIQDMRLMTSCDQHIIASTFSWWAAWLNNRPGKRVIAPSRWGYAQMGMVTDDLIPPGWEII